jgi:hypothetical protein
MRGAFALSSPEGGFTLRVMTVPGGLSQTAGYYTRTPNDPESGNFVGGSSPALGPPGVSVGQTAQNWDTANVLSQLDAGAKVSEEAAQGSSGQLRRARPQLRAAYSYAQV